MNKAICLVLAVLVLVFACSLPGYAHGAGYGRGGGWHGGGGGWHGGLWIGPGWGWDPWWWGAPGYPYYPYYPYYSDPAVIQHQPQEYIQRAPQQEQQYYWYFCPDSKNYSQGVAEACAFSASTRFNMRRVFVTANKHCRGET